MDLVTGPFLGRIASVHGPGGLPRSPAFSYRERWGSYSPGVAARARGDTKATPEETLEVIPAATLIEEPEEGDNAADMDYAADMAAAQSTWDPWPTPA